MELLEGETLDHTLAREQRLDVARVVDIMLQVGDALGLRPLGRLRPPRPAAARNIFLAARRGKANFVKLLDFGLLKWSRPGG